MAAEGRHSTENPERLEIHALGEFTVRFGDRVLSEETRRSKKLWRLFMYLLKHRGSEVPSEAIAEQLWKEGETADSRGALHNLVYRLRQLFEGLSPAEPPVTLDHSQVGYVLRLGDGSWYDVDEFMTRAQRAASVQETHPTGAIEAYRRAIALYEGHYLPGWPHEPWMMSTRRQYRGVYVHTLLELIEALRRPGRYSEVVEVCERALSIERILDTADLHHRFMEALTKEGQASEALRHYETISRQLRSEYAMEPSESLQRLYGMIRKGKENLQKESLQLDLAPARQQLLGAEEMKGAFLCDRDVFRYLLRLEARRSERSESNSFWGLVTVGTPDGQLPQGRILDRAMAQLQKVLTSNLRHGDAVSQWNEAQYLVLLADCAEETPHRCGERIAVEFDKAFGSGAMVLHYRFEAVQQADLP